MRASRSIFIKSNVIFEKRTIAGHVTHFDPVGPRMISGLSKVKSDYTLQMDYRQVHRLLLPRRTSSSSLKAKVEENVIKIKHCRVLNNLGDLW